MSTESPSSGESGGDNELDEALQYLTQTMPDRLTQAWPELITETLASPRPGRYLEFLGQSVIGPGYLFNVRVLNQAMATRLAEGAADFHEWHSQEKPQPMASGDPGQNRTPVREIYLPYDESKFPEIYSDELLRTLRELIANDGIVIAAMPNTNPYTPEGAVDDYRAFSGLWIAGMRQAGFSSVLFIPPQVRAMRADDVSLDPTTINLRIDHIFKTRCTSL